MNNVFKKIIVFSLLLLSIFVISCKNNDNNYVDLDTLIPTVYNGETIPIYYIHTEKQTKYLSGDYKLASVYGKGQEELGKSNGITIDFSSIVDDANSYDFELSTDEAFSNKKVYTVNEKKITLYNLMIKTVYYYRVIRGSIVSETKAFRVDDEKLRNLNIEGITNCRDIGGYKVNGVRTNQGMIYRTSKFNADESTESLITEAGIKSLVEDLNIKTEIDLRKTEENEYGGITSSPLGASVNYIHIPMVSGGNIILLNPDKIKDLFVILGDENNYPLVFHCSIGTDRTGMVSFLLLNILGVEKDDVYFDYLFSNFGVIGKMRTASIIDDYYSVIDSAPGKNYQEKTINYLVGIGVNRSDIDNFIGIMTK